MKIAFVLKELPYPLNNGFKVSTFNRLKELRRRGHELHLFVTSVGGSDATAVEKIRGFCESLKIYPIGLRQQLWNITRWPLLPIAASRRMHKRLSLDIATFFAEGRADVCIVDPSSHAMFFAPDRNLKVRRAIIFEELLHKGYLRVIRGLPVWSPRRGVLWIEAVRCGFLEARCLRERWFDQYWFYSHNDMQEVARHFPAVRERLRFLTLGVELRPPSVNGPPATPEFRPKDEIVLLVGNMDNPSNEDSARWFATKILPRVCAEVPNTKFVIIGKSSSRRLHDLASDSVRVIGEVGDLSPFLHRANVCVVPSRGGAGIRVKLLDALSAARVVVSTPIGGEANDSLRANEHYLLAHDDVEFAKKVTEVLQRPAEFEYMGARGFDFVRDHYSVQSATEDFEGRLKELVGSPGDA